VGVLKLIGLGLSYKFITEIALNELRTSDVVYADTYTSLTCGDLISRLHQLGINPIPVGRDFIENNYKKILELLDQGKSVGIAVIGDPMIATTHISLVTEARTKGHQVSIIPGVSVHCYIISKSMLSSYKFGKSVTIISSTDYGKIDTTPYKVLKENLERNLHTIFYLEPNMSARDAVSLLLQMEKIEEQGIINEDSLIIVGQHLGCDDEEIVSLKIKEIAKYNLKSPPHIIIFPSKSLHYMEIEGLKWLMK